MWGGGGGDLTKPSSNPSPVVAQLGTTNHILSFRVVSLRASVTSCGFIAVCLSVPKSPIQILVLMPRLRGEEGRRTAWDILLVRKY
jgi:hypothetical protein